MERILLDLVPMANKPICHASQFDNGREIGIDLVEGANIFKFKEGDTAVLKILKPDGTGLSSDIPVIEGNDYVVITVTQDMSDLEGTNLCELRIVNGNTDIGSSNFYMKMEKSVDSNMPPQKRGGLNTTSLEITSTTYTTGG